MMSVLALVGLAVLWAIVLIPDVIRRSAASRRSDTIGNFARQLSVLDSTPKIRSNVVPFDGHRRTAQPAPQPVAPLQARPSSLDAGVAPVRRAAAAPAPAARKTRQQQRRQEVLTALVAAAALTFLGTFAFGGVMVALNAVCDAALVLYLAAMFAVARREARPQTLARTYDYPLPSLTPVRPLAQQRRTASR